VDDCIHAPDRVDLIRDAPDFGGTAEVTNYDPGGPRREIGNRLGADFDRACSTTRCPSSRSDCAAARPRPSVLPVMKTIAISFPFDVHLERSDLLRAGAVVRAGTDI
jgi:hypothetical protein